MNIFNVIFLSFLFLSNAISSLAMKAEDYLSKEAIAALEKAQGNYIKRYFVRDNGEKFDFVVLFGERHIKISEEDSKQGKDVIEQFSYVGLENAVHYLKARPRPYIPEVNFLGHFSGLEDARRQGRGTSINDAALLSSHEACFEKELVEAIIKAVPVLKAGNENRSNLKQLLNLSPALEMELFIGGKAQQYIDKHGINSSLITSELSIENLRQLGSILLQQGSFLAEQDKTRLEKALAKLGEKIIKPISHQSDVSLGSARTRPQTFDLEHGCGVSKLENACVYASEVWNGLIYLALPSLATWWLTGNSTASITACAGLFCGMADLVTGAIARKTTRLSPYSRLYYVVGMDSRDTAMAKNIATFFSVQKESTTLLAIMGRTHIHGVGDRLVHEEGFVELYMTAP